MGLHWGLAVSYRPVMDRLAGWLAQIEERNADNVGRTQAYLELYTHTVDRGDEPDLPWLLMAHLVSRNAGYLMTEQAATIARIRRGESRAGFSADALEELFLFLERANRLIFHDAWWHVPHLIERREGELREGRTPRFVIEAYRRHRELPTDATSERALVLDLVTNEQRYIERRVAANPAFARAAAIVGFIEAMNREQPIALPLSDATITVGGFARLERRIEAGRRIYDEVLADRGRRREIHAWALEHPHTGARAGMGGKSTLTLREAWPVARVRAMCSWIHADPEPDPTHP